MTFALAFSNLSADAPRQRARCSATGRFVAWAKVPQLRIPGAPRVLTIAAPPVGVAEVAPVVGVAVVAEVVTPPVGSAVARVSRSVARVARSVARGVQGVARSVAGVARGAMRGVLSTVRAWGWTM